MNKKSMQWGQIIGGLLVILVIVVSISQVPKLIDLIKTSVGLGELDTNNINDEVTNEDLVRNDLQGKIIISLAKMEGGPAGRRPATPNHCAVGAVVTNTGEDEWTAEDKIKASLFCNDINPQVGLMKVKKVLTLQSLSLHIEGLTPAENRNIIFQQFPNDCIESAEKYRIELSSNCEGEGNNFEPCDNIGNSANPPSIFAVAEFNCLVD
jgi:hypothetical protein